MPQEPGDTFATDSAVTADDEAPSPEAPHDIVGKDALLARVGGDAELLGEMAAMFLDECPRHVSGIRQAVAGHDARSLESAAHALRGSVSNFTARRASQAALSLELMGRDGDLTGSEQALAALEEELERLKPVLEELK